MSSLKPRVKKLEAVAGAKDAPTWKAFVTGTWKPTPAEWEKFLKEKEQEHEQAKQQSKAS